MLSTFAAAIGQLFWKWSAFDFSWSLQGTLGNIPLLVGFLGHGIQLVLLVLAFRDIEVTVAYPIVSLGFVWVFLLSILFLNETVFFINWVGVISIMAGVFFITRCAA